MRKKSLIQKLLIYLMALMLMCPYVATAFPKQVQAASTASKAKSAYTAFIKKPVYWSSSYMAPSNIKFGLIDINNDKVPELYLATEKWDYDYDYKLYGYVDGKVKNLYSLRRFTKIQKVYPSTGTIYTYGELNKGRTERIYLQFDGKKITPKAASMSFAMNGGKSYYIPGKNKSTTISASTYNSIVKRLTSSSAKSAPKLYSNTAANRIKYLGNSGSNSKILFEKGTIYAFTNGGFYLKISKISGRKFTFSINMPYMSCYNQTASVGSDGKTATAKFVCDDRITHKLTFKVIKNGVSVSETSSCHDKLLESASSDGNKNTITQTFELDNYYSDYS